ncbi:MAG: hypothetical protein IKT70_10830 [Clostridia bacterium]|nr:hypothetical protein [Clostridia bacterium]
MKKFTMSFFAGLLASIMILSGCGNITDGREETTGTTDTTVSSDIPVINSAAHNITINDIDSMLAENGLKTNINSWFYALSYHGGMQTRVCHTERGTYTAFAKDFGDADGMQKFYVAKIDNEERVSLLYYGEFPYDDAEITINVGQDITGNIVVTAISESFHGLYIFDKDTDAITKYEMTPTFKSESKLGYNQTMFDFENRKVYPFLISGSGTDKKTVGDSIIEWYSFDLDTREWSEESVILRTEDIGRHGYLYPFPDGNGGAYIVAIRNEYSIYAEGRFSLSGESYLWDRLGLFYIPNLSNGENSEYVVVQDEDDSMGLEGIWSHIDHNNYGDVFIDSNGYMHITYRYLLMDYSGEHSEYDNQLQYRHAIYKGTECIYHEKLDINNEKYMYNKPMIRQSTDGRLHLIVARIQGDSASLEFYRAGDELGKVWEYQKTHTFDGVTIPSLSLSSTRDGSLQDNTVSGFYYRTYGKEYNIYNGYTTPHTFSIDLDDYSVTDPVYVLDGFDLMVDWRHDERVPSSDDQTQIISTNNGIYAAFVYNYDQGNGVEQFCIVKVDGEGKSTLLHTDSYESEQDKYLTMTAGDDGTIYVCPSTGRTVYTVDTDTDEVTLIDMTPIVTKNLIPRQTNIIINPLTGNKYQVSVLFDGSMNISSNIIDPEKFTVKVKNALQYVNDRELIGCYESIYTLNDGKSGVYMVGTRVVDSEDLEGKLEYNGHTDKIVDSVMLFYLPDLADGTEVQCIDVHLPYEDEGTDGIWSSVDVKDVYLDKDGKLNILYSDCHFDYDDSDRRENDELEKNTLKYYLAIYENGELVSRKELSLDGLTKDSSVRIAETSDGTVYLIICNLQSSYKLISFGLYPEGEEAKISVYFETDDGWNVAAEKVLGEFAAEGLFVTDVNDNVVDCLVYASNNDVYYMSIAFDKKD